MPAIHEDTPYGELTIAGLTFQVPRPYKQGDILTEGEASQLNQVFSENLRNNFAAKIRSKIDEYKKASGLSEDQEVGADVLDKDTLDAEFEEYAEKYEFGVRAASGGPRAPSDPIGREAVRIAWERIKAALKKKNYQLDSISKEQKAKLIADALARYPNIREEAERRVNASADIVLDEVAA